jgi:hypothetical protein
MNAARPASRPRVTEDRQQPLAHEGIFDGWIEYGTYRVRVRRWANGAGISRLWHQEPRPVGCDDVVFELDGRLHVPGGDGAHPAPWALIDGLCRVERPYVGGPLRALPHGRRLEHLRLNQLAGVANYWSPVLRVYAGPYAWSEAKAAMAEPGDVPLVVLPPGDDPRSFDWAPLGRWRYTRKDAAEVKGDASFAEDPVRAGAGYQVRVYDETGPVCEDTKDLIAASCLMAGCSLVTVRMAPLAWALERKGRLVTYRPQPAPAVAGAA